MVLERSGERDQHEFLLKESVRRASLATEKWSGYQTGKKSRSSPTPRRWTGLKEIGPPTPISPANMMPTFLSRVLRTQKMSGFSMDAHGERGVPSVAALKESVLFVISG